MSEQVRVGKVKSSSRRHDVSTDWSAPRDAQKKRAELKRELDEVLAEIDVALEGIEEDFATTYTQYGGE